MNLEQLKELLDPDVDCDPKDREAYLHFRSLGLTAADEYREWCQRHGFSTRLTKTWQQRLRERAFLFRPVADARLAQRKRERRAPEKVIRAIFHGQLVEDQLVAPCLKEICRACQAARQRPNYERNLFRVLMHAMRHANLLAMEPVVPHLGRREGNTFVGGLAALARHSAGWLRDVENWRPRTHSSRRQFSSLARHLFAEWPVPLFMDSVWFKGASGEALRQQGWFLHLGRGENIRTADLPLPYTKKMSHYFVQAPSDLGIEGALRWGQVHALGGSERLARAIVGTWLETDLEHDDFVLSVLRFLLAHPALDNVQVRRLAEYIYDLKFRWRHEPVDQHRFERTPPPRPNFCMKGRTLASLQKEVGGLERTRKPRQPWATWPASGIPGFKWIEGSQQTGDLKTWTINELVSPQALVAEARAMQHCVAGYMRACAGGYCSIWTMEVESLGQRRKVLTIELDMKRRSICQARGKRNAEAKKEHLAILRLWAGQAGLRVSAGV